MTARGANTYGVVSPGFTSRPSLSAAGARGWRRRGPRVSPGFTSRPSLSDQQILREACAPGVSPGFTSRPSLSGWGLLGCPQRANVSPGFTSRPSLSALGNRRLGVHQARVAGIHVPAFVERTMTSMVTGCTRRVSPGFTSRPSLSVQSSRSNFNTSNRVSPGFTSRPSLSGQVRPRHPPKGLGVAGIHVPAFVERRSTGTRWRCRTGCRRDSRPGLR